MKEYKDIRDDQIRIIGQSESGKKPIPQWVRIAIVVLLVVLIGGAILLTNRPQEVQVKENEVALFEPTQEPVKPTRQWLGMDVDSLAQGFTEMVDTIINDIPLTIFIPHNAEMSLHVGRLDHDESIVYAAQAIVHNRWRNKQSSNFFLFGLCPQRRAPCVGTLQEGLLCFNRRQGKRGCGPKLATI